jgi:CENP-B N-terminal DNA-binding domain.
MSSKRSALNPSEWKNVAKKSHMSVTLEKKIEVIHRTGDGETHPNVCRGMKLPVSTVSTETKN